MAKLNNERPLTMERLNEVLEYNKGEGKFYWRVTGSPRAIKGRIAGAIRKRGYRIITIDRVQYKANRLVWFYHAGSWSEKFIDHINGDKTDDRIENLREVDDSENAWNVGKTSRNTSGYKGVSFASSVGKWQASICRRKQAICLGYFDTPEGAYAAYCKAALALHGEFSRLA